MPIGIYIELQNLTADTYAAVNARLSGSGRPTWANVPRCVPRR